MSPRSLRAWWCCLAVCIAACHAPPTSVDNSGVVLQRILFGSCCDQRRPQPIWDAVFAARPDLFLFTGDNIYSDAATTKQLLDDYEAALRQPGYHRLLDGFRVLATYDDHDFGQNNSGRENPIRVESARACLDAFRVPADDPRRAHEGVYGAYRFGPPGRRVQVVLLDTRYFRDPLLIGGSPPGPGYGPHLPNEDPAATMLGAAQWTWLAAVLAEPADLRLIVSSVQFLADEHRKEGWGNFPLERRRMFDLLRATRAEGVVFLSGDVHYAEVSVDTSLGYPLYDVTASPLEHRHAKADAAPSVYSQVANRYRIPESSYTGTNFGSVVIDWGGAESRVTLSLHRGDGTVAFRRALRLGDLRFARR